VVREIPGFFVLSLPAGLLEDRLNRRLAFFFENFGPPFPENKVTNGNTSRGSARQRFLTNHRSLPKHFRAAAAGSLNSQHTLSQLSPSDLRKTTRESYRSHGYFSVAALCVQWIQLTNRSLIAQVFGNFALRFP
jgi:hypothetical protein